MVRMARMIESVSPNKVFKLTVYVARKSNRAEKEKQLRRLLPTADLTLTPFDNDLFARFEGFLKEQHELSIVYFTMHLARVASNTHYGFSRVGDPKIPVPGGLSKVGEWLASIPTIRKSGFHRLPLFSRNVSSGNVYDEFLRSHRLTNHKLVFIVDACHSEYYAQAGWLEKLPRDFERVDAEKVSAKGSGGPIIVGISSSAFDELSHSIEGFGSYFREALTYTVETRELFELPLQRLSLALTDHVKDVYKKVSAFDFIRDFLSLYFPMMASRNVKQISKVLLKQIADAPFTTTPELPVAYQAALEKSERRMQRPVTQSPQVFVSDRSAWLIPLFNVYENTDT